MFCFLEKIELKIDYCPAKCMYRDKARQCGYQKLTPDTDENDVEVPVTTQTISAVKGIKFYKIRDESARAKIAIRMGLLILKYAEYIKRQRPLMNSVSEEIRDFVIHRTTQAMATQQQETSEIDDYAKVEETLISVFGLGVEHRQMFFDQKVFKAWATEAEVDVSYNKVVQALIDLPPMAGNKVVASPMNSLSSIPINSTQGAER